LIFYQQHKIIIVFEPVADVFRASFEEGKELGASFVIYKDGQPIINMLGGWADRRKTVPVTNETLFAVFSSGKVPAALVIAWLVDQDRIGYDQLAASIWPEFGVNGKEEITIGDMLSHQTGLRLVRLGQDNRRACGPSPNFSAAHGLWLSTYYLWLFNRRNRPPRR